MVYIISILKHRDGEVVSTNSTVQKHDGQKQKKNSSNFFASSLRPTIGAYTIKEIRTILVPLKCFTSDV